MALVALAPGRQALAQAGQIEQYRPHDIALRAPVPGNPHNVELAGVVRGPDGTALRVPGFYDGEDRWVIRFTAPLPGKWTVRTTSNVPALSGQQREFVASPAANGSVHGVLQVDAAARRHFRFADGTPFFAFGYEADWLWGAGMQDPKRTLMRRLIEQIDDNGFNYVLVNVYAHDTRWAPGKSCEWDFGPPAMYAFGGSNALPDHSRMNPAFFQVYDQMMWALWERGIIAHVMIKVYNKNVNWPAAGSEDEARYFRYVVARYQAFPNLVWDFSKEAKNEKNDLLERNLIQLIRAGDAYRHLVTIHDDETFMAKPDLGSVLDFQTIQRHADYQQVIRFSRAIHPGPLLFSEFGYEYGVEALPTHKHRNQATWQEFLDRAYTVVFSGAHPVYYYNNTAWDVVKPDPEPPGMKRWKLLKEIVVSLPYAEMQPHDDLAAGALCLARPGRVYVFYTSRAELRANLHQLTGKAQAVWINTWTGERQPATEIEPGIHLLKKPREFGDAPSVLIVKTNEVRR